MAAASLVEEDLSIPLVSSTTGQSYRLYGKEVKLVPDMMMTLSPSTNDEHETTTTNDSVQDEEAANNNHERDDDSRHPDDDDTSPASCCCVVIVVHGGPGLADSSESFPGLKRLLLAAGTPAKGGGRRQEEQRQEGQQGEQEDHPKRRQQQKQQVSILHAMIFYDQLGCGKSDKPTSMEEYSLSAYVNELSQVIAYCRARHSSDNNRRLMMCLLGHSWGGQVILEYLLSLDPNDTTPAAAAPHCAVISNAPLDATSYQAKQVELRESLDPETREFYEREEEQEIAQNPGVGARIFRKLVGNSDTRITGELKEWTIMKNHRLKKRLCTPCLFVCCEDDTVPVADYLKLLQEKGSLLADKQCCEVTILPEGGHGPFYGASAPMYFERILSFLLGTQPAV